MALVAALEVTRAWSITPRMRRLRFRGAGLSELDTWPDQQLKLLLPREGQTEPVLPVEDPGDLGRWYPAFLAIPEEQRPVMRSFTVRALDRAAGTMDIDVVLHGDAGPASRWARLAEPGAVLARYGPDRGYARPLPAADHYLFAGDESALPAVASLLTSLPATAHAEVYLEVHDAAERQPLPSPASADVHWVHRAEGAELVHAVTAAELPGAPLTGWLAGEAGAVRALRRWLVAQGVPKAAIEFTGYWRRTLSQDDAPTAEDLAEAQERLGG